MAFFGLIGNDRKMAATNYSGRESATAKKQRKDTEASNRRRAGHRNRGAADAARRGQAWEDSGRQFGGRR
jgi:hypothetical protein